MRTTKRYITLIEIIIVMLLITIISGSVAYKVKKGLDHGKAFKTHEAIQKIKLILDLELNKTPGKRALIEKNWMSYIKKSPLTEDPKRLEKDGWGEDYKVAITKSRSGAFNIKVTSKAYLNGHYDTLFEG
jgi:general secretion pathway protein G